MDFREASDGHRKNLRAFFIYFLCHLSVRVTDGYKSNKNLVIGLGSAGSSSVTMMFKVFFYRLRVLARCGWDGVFGVRN